MTGSAVAGIGFSATGRTAERTTADRIVRGPMTVAKQIKQVPTSGTGAGNSRPPLHLGYMYWANGTHPAGWRYPGAEFARAFDADYIVGLAQTVEAAKFDFFFFGDRLATGTEYQWTNTSVIARIEPFTAAAYLATLTNKIGLVVTANPTYYDHLTSPASWHRSTTSRGDAPRGTS